MGTYYYGYRPKVSNFGLFLVVLCRVEKMQVGSGLDNFRENRVGSVRVESGNVNKICCISYYQHYVTHINPLIEGNYG